MYILNIYKASFDSDSELVPILEPKYVSDDINLLKEKLIEIINDSDIKLSEYQKRSLQQNIYGCIGFDFNNCYNRFDWDDIVSIEIKKIEQLK